ncbi:unnamed protein product [Soboliphyme baturini]|uniref:Ovate family protein n=1 Tax=Soboliphyme baturini TaxID=241478 RepID=A0A183J525_9BILA|nr:unnamed protein product [Soboliphyme baturini]
MTTSLLSAFQPKTSSRMANRHSCAALFQLSGDHHGHQPSPKSRSVPEGYFRPRLRHNSFPFAALLMESSSPVFDKRSRGGSLRHMSQRSAALGYPSTVLRAAFHCHPSTSSAVAPSGTEVEIYQRTTETAESTTSAKVGESSDEESNSSDDSFVRIEMQSICAPSDGSDLGAFYKEFKSASSELKSFLPPTSQYVCQLAAGLCCSSGLSYKETDTSEEDALRKNSGSFDTFSALLNSFERQQVMFDAFLASLNLNSTDDEEEASAER